MNDAAMVECAYELVRVLKDDLMSRNTVEPVLILLHDRGCDLIRFEPVLFTTQSGKDAIGAVFRRRATEVSAYGAIVGLDSHCLVPDIPAMLNANPKLVRAAAAAGIDALVRSGFGRKSEALAVTLETPSFELLLEQLYTRGENGLVFGELMDLDSRRVPVTSAGVFKVFGRRCQASE
jgi:hypothetical protein